jgi:hypothetical protein
MYISLTETNFVKLGRNSPTLQGGGSFLAVRYGSEVRILEKVVSVG